MTFLEVDAELKIFLHDRFVDLVPLSMFLTLDDIVKRIKRPLGLSHIQKLCKNVQKCVDS